MLSLKTSKKSNLWAWSQNVGPIKTTFVLQKVLAQGLTLGSGPFQQFFLIGSLIQSRSLVAGLIAKIMSSQEFTRVDPSSNLGETVETKSYYFQIHNENGNIE